MKAYSICLSDFLYLLYINSTTFTVPTFIGFTVKQGRPTQQTIPVSCDTCYDRGSEASWEGKAGTPNLPAGSDTLDELRIGSNQAQRMMEVGEDRPSHRGFTQEDPGYVQFTLRGALQLVVPRGLTKIVLVLGKPGISEKGVWTCFQES